MSPLQSLPASLTTTINQVAAKNPLVGNAIARASVSAAILSGQQSPGTVGATLPGAPDQQSGLTGSASSQTDPTLQIVGAVNAHLGQTLNIHA